MRSDARFGPDFYLDPDSWFQTGVGIIYFNVTPLKNVNETTYRKNYAKKDTPFYIGSDPRQGKYFQANKN